MDERDKDNWSIWGLVTLLTMIALIHCCQSCKQIEYVPVNTIVHDSVYQTKLKIDTLITKDSVFIQKLGDTIAIDRWHTIYKVKIHTDTLNVQHTDSIQVPYPVVKKEEVKYTPLFTKILAWIGGIVLFCFLATLIIYIYNLMKP